MSGPRIAILSPVPEYEEDWSYIRADYVRLFGQETDFIDWTQAQALNGYDLITPLLAWGYQRDCTAWFALLDRLEQERLPVVNPVSVVRWNSDKSYLADLADAGVATVPTTICTALDDNALDRARIDFGTGSLVVKPLISGGADGTFRISGTDGTPDLVAGQRMMIQPFMPAIVREGEYSLFYFDGEFSHAIIKRPAPGDFRVQDKFGGYEEAITAPGAAQKLAEASLLATGHITRTGPLAYARVDMVRDGDGIFRLMELELIEPSLFLHFAPDQGAAFARAMHTAIARNHIK